jgi:hypothetical protein
MRTVTPATTLRRGLGLAALCLFLAGCGGRQPPAVTEVEGVLLLDGRPLPSAQLEFLPEQEGLGPEWIATGLTDKDGRFQLSLSFQQKPGAAVGSHRVVVRDAPPPADARGQDERSQERLNKYLDGLANRPIPAVYKAAGTTTARVEVKADQKAYEIKLKR